MLHGENSCHVPWRPSHSPSLPQSHPAYSTVSASVSSAPVPLLLLLFLIFPTFTTNRHGDYFATRCEAPFPFRRTIHTNTLKKNKIIYVPVFRAALHWFPPLHPCIPANAALTSLLPSLSLLSKPILSLLHQLRWAEAHCAKCHLISLSLAAAVIVRTFPLFRRHISLLPLSAVRWRDGHHPQHRHPSRAMSPSSPSALVKSTLCGCVPDVCTYKHFSLLARIVRGMHVASISQGNQLLFPIGTFLSAAAVSCAIIR